jgi:CBS domain-containing protein
MKTTKIKDLMTRDIISVNLNDSVDKIALVMTEKRIGSVLVYDNDDFIGLITKRDMLERVLLDCLNPCEIFAKDIVTKNPITMSDQEIVANCLKMMYKHKIKRIPIISSEEGKIIGIITSYDIIAAFNSLDLH